MVITQDIFIFYNETGSIICKYNNIENILCKNTVKEILIDLINKYVQ